MGIFGTRQARDALITMLDDDVLEVRLAAAAQLGRLGDISGESVVLSVFDKGYSVSLDTETNQRIYVLTALAIGQIRTPKLTKFLPQLLINESKFVRIAAAKAVFLSGIE
jgi:HEAT repeat protein